MLHIGANVKAVKWASMSLWKEPLLIVALLRGSGGIFRAFYSIDRHQNDGS